MGLLPERTYIWFWTPDLDKSYQCLGFKLHSRLSLAQIEIPSGLARSHAATAATGLEPISGTSTDQESTNCSIAPALLNVRDYKDLRCSLQVYWLALPMHHAGFSRHALWLGTNPSPNTVVLNGKISLRHCFFSPLSRAAWPQLSFSSDSKGMCSGQPPRLQSCWKVSPFIGEHTTNLCSGLGEAAEYARNNQMKKEGKKTVVYCANERQIPIVWFLCHIFF